jgi:hypothetical protein
MSSSSKKINGYTVEDVYFVVVEMSTRLGTYKLDKLLPEVAASRIAKEQTEGMGKTSVTSASALVNGILSINKDAKINPSCVYAEGVWWYDNAKNPKYIKGSKKEPKFSKDIDLDCIAEWLLEEGNTLNNDVSFGKPQLRNPKSLKTKGTKEKSKPLAMKFI